jgi:hypothetical protein
LMVRVWGGGVSGLEDSGAAGGKGMTALGTDASTCQCVW